MSITFEDLPLRAKLEVALVKLAGMKFEEDEVNNPIMRDHAEQLIREALDSLPPEPTPVQKKIRLAVVKPGNWA